MRLILCASSWSLISHWSADGRDCTVAKGQKDLLEILKDTLELPIIILEESLYEDLAPIITLLKEINPASTVLIMA